MNNKINPLGVTSTPGARIDGGARKSSAQDVSSVSATANVSGIRSQDDSVQLQARRTLDGGAKIDSAKVEKLREAIQSGQYQVDARTISSRLLDLEQALR